MPRVKDKKFNINAEAFEVVNQLMDIIERELPEFYYKSDEIARAEDFLVILENEPDFKGMEKRDVKTKEEARQYAIDWQNWASEQNLSYGELAEWQNIFSDLAKKYDLEEEFRENGII